jgi:hypothetical protein
LHLLLGVVDREEEDLADLRIDVVVECVPLEAVPSTDVLGRRVDEERARVAVRDPVADVALADIAAAASPRLDAPGGQVDQAPLRRS